MPNSVSDVKEQRVSETCDTLKHNAGFVELESSTLGDAVTQYAVLKLSEDVLRLIALS